MTSFDEDDDRYSHGRRYDWLQSLVQTSSSVDWGLAPTVPTFHTLSGNPARDSHPDDDNEFEDDHDRQLWAGHRETGQVLAAARTRLRQNIGQQKHSRSGHLIRHPWNDRDDLKLAPKEDQQWWDTVTDQPITTNVRWAGSNYQLPLVPKQRPKDPTRRQRILEQTVHGLKISNTSTPWREKYEALSSRFAVARILQTQVAMRTEMFKDLSSNGYAFSEVVILDRALQPVAGFAVDGINIDARRRGMIKYISTTVTTRPDQLPQANTISDLPGPEMKMDVLIKLPIFNGGLHPSYIMSDTLLDPAAALRMTRTIPTGQGGGTIHAGLRRHGQMAPEPFTEWLDNEIAKLDFAVMNSLLRREYINADATSSPDTRLRMTTQRYQNPQSGIMITSTVAEFYERILGEVHLLDRTVLYMLNIPKIFHDGLLPKIREVLTNKGVVPPAMILPNNLALDELFRLKKAAEEIEKEHNLLTDLVHQAIDRNPHTRMTRSFPTSRARAMLSTLSTSPGLQRTTDEYYCSDDETSYLDNQDQPQFHILPKPVRHRVAFALVSIAEKAMREASGTRAPLKCWGCEGAHLFGACPHKNKAEVIERYKQRLSEYMEKGGARTRVLAANKITYEWQALGFHNQRQAELLLDIMKVDTSKAARNTLLHQLFTPKALLVGTKSETEDTEIGTDTSSPSKPTRRVFMFTGNPRQIPSESHAAELSSGASTDGNQVSRTTDLTPNGTRIDQTAETITDGRPGDHTSNAGGITKHFDSTLPSQAVTNDMQYWTNTIASMPAPLPLTLTNECTEEQRVKLESEQAQHNRDYIHRSCHCFICLSKVKQDEEPRHIVCHCLSCLANNSQTKYHPPQNPSLCTIGTHNFDFCLKRGRIDHILDPKPFPPKPYWYDWRQWDFYDRPIDHYGDYDTYMRLSIDYKQTVRVWLSKRGLSHDEMDRDAKLLWHEEGIEMPLNQQTIYIAGICACKECRTTRQHYETMLQSPNYCKQTMDVCTCSICISEKVKIEDDYPFSKRRIKLIETWDRAPSPVRSNVQWSVKGQLNYEQNSDNEDDDDNKKPACLFTIPKERDETDPPDLQTDGKVFQVSKKTRIADRRFRLTSSLPHIEIQIGNEDTMDGETFHLRGCLDSCAGGTIGYRPYHEHIIDLHPHLVHKFIDYKKEGIKDLLIGGIEEEGDGIRITAEVNYKTPYLIDGVAVELIVGLSDDMSANTIFGLPLQNKAKFIINLEDNIVTSMTFRTTFQLSFQIPARYDEVTDQYGSTNKILTTSHKSAAGPNVPSVKNDVPSTCTDIIPFIEILDNID